MSYYFKLAVIASLMLTASVMTDARYEITSKEMMAKGLVEAEIKALAELKEVENLVIAGDQCLPSGRVCGSPAQCCSAACVAHPWRRVFVCA